MTLVILAAGMGSRYGGMKQIDPITPNGEFIIDFTIFDAIREGFDKVVFVIKRENLELFRETVGSRIEKKVKVEYAFQDMNDLPEGFSLPADRVKPWGTGHAVLAARKVVNDNFAAVNADDFYGRDAFRKLAAHLKTAGTVDGASEFCMVGYVLDKTLTENGSVSRGQCEVNGDGYLTSIVERTKIVKGDTTAMYEENGEWKPIANNTTVSMNCFGFTPEIFAHLENGFASFLESHINEPKSEYYIPGAVFEMMQENSATVKVYTTDSNWYGVTYHDDKPAVVSAIRKLIENGEYPDNLWK